MATDVTVPTLGESITEATLGKWLKRPGDPVKADEPVASLETDKVAVDVPSPVAGTMSEQVVAEGATVTVGAVIARIDQNGTAKVAPPPGTSGEVNPPGPGETPATRVDEHAPVAEEEHEALTLSPAVRRLVLEHGLDPSRIRGTGKDGRLTKDDVLAAAKHAPAPEAKAAAPAPAPTAPAAPPPAPA